MGYMERANETQGDFLINDNALNASTKTYDEVGLYVPQWILYIYFIFVAWGAVVNLTYCLALSRCRKNGTLALIMQLCAVDFLFIFVAVMEIFSLNNHSWIFSPETCPFFNGMETLINSLALWFIICLNFHVISLWNLHKNEVKKKTKNPLTSCEDESNECLVTKKENINRTLNIDYRKRKNDVSVILPTILIWFFCVSLSIPNFTLSLTLTINESHTICAIVDNLYGHILQRLLLILRVLLPMFLLVFALIVLIKKLAKTSQNDIDTVLTQKFCEIKSLLIFCIAVTLLYIITSFQRNSLQLLHLISQDLDKHTAVIFRMPPLYNNRLNNSKSVYLAMFHYSGTSFRALLYIFLLPKFSDLVKNRICGCCGKTEK